MEGKYSLIGEKTGSKKQHKGSMKCPCGPLGVAGLKHAIVSERNKNTNTHLFLFPF